MHYKRRPPKPQKKKIRLRKWFIFLVLAATLFGIDRLFTSIDISQSDVIGAILPLQLGFYEDPTPEIRIPPPIHAINELDEMLRRHGNYLSVYFENLETGFVYQYNADRVYFSASVPKAFFALHIYLLAERGVVDLDSVHSFTYADSNWGSGIIQREYNFGAIFPVRELLRLNLSKSDNVATLMLRRIFGINGYINFVEESGGTPSFVRDRVMNSDITANEAGLFARLIFEYIESGGVYSEEFRAHLLDNQFPFIVSDYPVASKSGWTSPVAWHDMAIVYAPSPYVLVILSEREGFTQQDFTDFEEISMMFQRFNDRWF